MRASRAAASAPASGASAARAARARSSAAGIASPEAASSGVDEGRAGLDRLARARGLALVGGAGLLVGPALGLVVLLRRAGAAAGEGAAGSPGLEARAGAPRRRPGPRLLGDRLQGLGVGEPLDRGHRHGLLLDLQGQGEERRAVLDPAEGEQAGRGVRRTRARSRRGASGRRGARTAASRVAASGAAFATAARCPGSRSPATAARRHRLVVLVHREVGEARLRLLAHARRRRPRPRSRRARPTSASFFTAARRTRASASSRARASRTSRSEEGRRSTASARTAGSACCHSGLLRNRSMSVFRVVSTTAASGPPTITPRPRPLGAQGPLAGLPLGWRA